MHCWAALDALQQPASRRPRENAPNDALKAPMRPLHLFALGFTLATLVSLPAHAGDDGPRLPCGVTPQPSWTEPGQPPAVQAWRGAAARGWAPPACTGWSAASADILVAVAGSFKHDGDIDTLLARIGAISAKTNVRYWSTTEKRWQPLVTEAFALSGPDAAQRREDFTPAQFVKGQNLHYAQSDNRSSGKTVYRERVLQADRDRLVVVSENLSPVKMMLITLFDSGDMQTAYFVERRAPGVWNFYSLTRTRMASSLMPIGSDASYINRAVAFYRLVAAIPTDQEPPAAR
jgi:hypothetical protein